MIDGVSTSAPENEEHEKSAVIKKISRGDQITTVRQVTMSQLSCGNHPWACFYLKANASSGCLERGQSEVYYFAYAPGRRMHLQ